MERQKKEKARGSEVSSSAAPVEAGMLGLEGVCQHCCAALELSGLGQVGLVMYSSDLPQVCAPFCERTAEVGFRPFPPCESLWPTSAPLF
ncbi:hypothetical protein AOLI_G00184440 [Acnodon oligacanthus]